MLKQNEEVVQLETTMPQSALEPALKGEETQTMQ